MSDTLLGWDRQRVREMREDRELMLLGMWKFSQSLYPVIPAMDWIGMWGTEGEPAVRRLAHKGLAEFDGNWRNATLTDKGRKKAQELIADGVDG